MSIINLYYIKNYKHWNKQNWSVQFFFKIKIKHCHGLLCICLFWYIVLKLRKMTWSTTEEDSPFLNLLTSNPVAENMRSDGTDVPGILRYWRASTDNLGYLILFSFHHFKGFTLGSHLSRLYKYNYVSSDECLSFKWLSILLVPPVYFISKLHSLHFTIFDSTSRLKYAQAFDCGGDIL
jgi:hypothetical protein